MEGDNLIKVVGATYSPNSAHPVFGLYTPNAGLSSAEAIRLAARASIGFQLTPASFVEELRKKPFNFIENTNELYYPDVTGVVQKGGNALSYFEARSEIKTKNASQLSAFLSSLTCAGMTLLGSKCYRIVWPKINSTTPAEVKYFLQLRVGKPSSGMEVLGGTPAEPFSPIDPSAGSVYLGKHTAVSDRHHLNAWAVFERVSASSVSKLIETYKFHVKDNDTDNVYTYDNYRLVTGITSALGKTTSHQIKRDCVNDNYPNLPAANNRWYYYANRYKAEGDNSDEGWYSGFAARVIELNLLQSGWHLDADANLLLQGATLDVHGADDFFINLPIACQSAGDLSGTPLSDAAKVIAVNESVFPFEKLMNFKIVGDTLKLELYGLSARVKMHRRISPSKLKAKKLSGSYDVTQVTSSGAPENVSTVDYPSVYAELPIITMALVSTYDQLTSTWINVDLDPANPDQSDEAAAGEVGAAVEDSVSGGAGVDLEGWMTILRDFCARYKWELVAAACAVGAFVYLKRRK